MAFYKKRELQLCYFVVDPYVPRLPASTAFDAGAPERRVERSANNGHTPDWTTSCNARSRCGALAAAWGGLTNLVDESMVRIESR